MDALYGNSYLEMHRIGDMTEQGSRLRANHPGAIPRYGLVLIEEVGMPRGEQRLEILPK